MRSVFTMQSLNELQSDRTIGMLQSGGTKLMSRLCSMLQNRQFSDNGDGLTLLKELLMRPDLDICPSRRPMKRHMRLTYMQNRFQAVTLIASTLPNGWRVNPHKILDRLRSVGKRPYWPFWGPTDTRLQSMFWMGTCSCQYWPLVARCPVLGWPEVFTEWMESWVYRERWVCWTEKLWYGPEWYNLEFINLNVNAQGYRESLRFL